MDAIASDVKRYSGKQHASQWGPDISPRTNSCECFHVTLKYTNQNVRKACSIKGLETFCQQQPKYKSSTLEGLRPAHKHPRRTWNCEPHCATFWQNSSNLIDPISFRHEVSTWWMTNLYIPGPYQLETNQKTDRPEHVHAGVLLHLERIDKESH